MAAAHQEAEIFASTRHPYVLERHETFSEWLNFCIGVEHATGNPSHLTQLFQSLAGGMPEAEVIGYLRKICSALVDIQRGVLSTGTSGGRMWFSWMREVSNRVGSGHRVARSIGCAELNGRDGSIRLALTPGGYFRVHSFSDKTGMWACGVMCYRLLSSRQPLERERAILCKQPDRLPGGSRRVCVRSSRRRGAGQGPGQTAERGAGGGVAPEAEAVVEGGLVGRCVEESAAWAGEGGGRRAGAV
jgi:hypothetical protein